MKHFNTLKRLLLIPLLVLGASMAALAQPMSGVYTIGGTSPDFATLAAAVSAVNSRGVSGPTWFKIRTGTYTSTTNWVGQVNTITGASATNRVTFESETGNRNDVTITNANSSTANYVFKLNSANYITIRNMTLVSTSTSYSRIVELAGSSSYDSIYNCNLTAPTVSSTSNNLAVVYASPLTGTNDVVYNNTISNGSYGILLAGTSSSTLTANHVFSGNNITGQYQYGIRTDYTSNLQVLNNTVSRPGNTTTYYGMYFNYGNDAHKVNGNTISITATSSSVYAIYATYCLGSATTTAARGAFKNNNISISNTSGTQYAFNMNTGNTYDSVLNNTITQSSSSSASVYPFYNYSNTYTVFTGNSVTGTSTSSAYYYNAPAYYSSNSVFKNNTLSMTTTSGAMYPMYYAGYGGSNNEISNNTVTGTATTSGSAYAWYYALSSSSSNNTVSGNTMNFSLATSGSRYGWYYSLYSNSSNNTVTNNTMNFTGGTGLCYGFYYSFYATSSGNTMSGNSLTFTTATSSTNYGMYYTFYSSANNNNYTNNTLSITNTGSGSQYGMYYSMYSSSGGNNMTGNTFTYNTANSGTNYGTYYSFYSSCSNNTFNNNNVSFINNGSGSLYGMYYSVYASSTNNTFNNNTLYYKSNGIVYGMYYSAYSGSDNFSFRNNTFTVQSVSSSAYGSYYTGNNINGLKWSKNTISVTAPSATYGCYMLAYYCSNSNIDSNSLTVGGGTSTTYGLYLYPYSGQNITVRKNTLSVGNNSSGTTYGLYLYNYYLNTGNYIKVEDNKVNAYASSGTVYGFYAYYFTNGMVKNNAVATKTTGTAYALYDYNYYSGTDTFINNTFSNGGTGSSSYAAYIYAYPGSAQFGGETWYNNVFANTATSNTPVFIGYQGAPLRMDYNNYYAKNPSNPNFSCVYTPYSYNSSPTGTWTIPQLRALPYDNDKGSLAYNPGFYDSTSDLRPNPARPESWSVNGRGVHLSYNNKDILGNTRVTTKPAGVPDLGAYEFTPTSTPPLAVAVPTVPAASTTQRFYFGQDTVMIVDWPATPTPPADLAVRQYTGTVAPGLSVLGPSYMYFYVDAQPTGAGPFTSATTIFYKDPWTGTIAETSLRMAQKENSTTAWTAHAYTVSGANAVRNTIYHNSLPNFGMLTGFDIANNAGALAIASPTPKFCAGTYPLIAKIANLGNNTITSVQVGWSIDGVLQNPVSYTTAIPTLAAGNNEANVTLGSVTFTNKAKVFKIWTYNPNNVTDPVPMDDTITVKWGPGLSGEYTVGGTSPDYATVTDAVTDLKQFGVCGPVWFNIRNGNYTGQYDLPGNVAGMNSTNRVTFRSESGVAANVNLNSGGAFVFRLNGASYYTIRNLSLNATSTSAGYGIQLAGTVNADTIDGCNITVASPTSSFCVPVYYNQANSNGLTIINNTLTNGYYGLYLYGNSGTPSTNLYVANNKIFEVYMYSIYSYYHTSPKYIGNLVNSTSIYGYPIYMYYCPGMLLDGNTVIKPNSSYYGMLINYNYATASAPNIVRNNVITIGTGSTTPTCGMYLYYNQNTQVYNNSIRMEHSSAPAMYVYTTSGYNVVMKNNVMANFGGGPAMYASLSSGDSMDYNNYYTTGTQLTTGTYSADSLTTWRNMSGFDKNSISYNPGFTTNTNLMPDVNNAAAWSLNGRGVHIAGNDKDINGNPRVVNRADGVPDIGAYEFVPATIPPLAKAFPATATAGTTQVFTFGQDTVARINWNANTVVPTNVEVRQYTGTIPPSFPVANHMYFYTDISSIPVTYILDADIFYKDPWTGKIPASEESNIRMVRKESSATPWTVYNDVNSTINTSRNVLSNTILTGLGYFTGIEKDSLFSANIRPQSSVVFCPGGSVTLQSGYSGSNYSYQWQLNGNNISGATSSSYTAIQAGDYSVRVTEIASGKTATSNKVAVTIVSTPTALVNVNGPLTICTGNTVTLTSNTGSGLSYQWVRNGIDIPNETNPTYVVNAGGSYAIKVKNIGCTNISAPVTIIQAPVNVNLGNDTSFCTKSPLNLDATNPGAKYMWSTGDTTQTITITQYGHHKVWVHVDAGVNCIAKDTIDVEISPMPQIVGISSIRVSGDTYRFDPSGAQYVDSYLWLFSDGSSDTSRSITHNYSGGDVKLKLVVFNGCGSDTTDLDLATLNVKDVTAGSEFSLYPNPAQERITLSVSGEAKFNDVVIVNSIGQVVLRQLGAENVKSRTINIQGLPDGHYLIRANTADGKIISKPFQIIR